MSEQKSGSPLVSIIILNWNSREDVIACVHSCLDLDYPHFRILLVDNGSTDGSAACFREHFPDIELIENRANLGYAAGNNSGIRFALEQGAEFIWILNPDIRVESSSLSTLIAMMQRDARVGVCGPRILQGDPENRACFDGLSILPDKGYEPRFNMLENWFTETSPDPWDVDCVSGCSMLVRNQLFRKIGLLREDFFLYYEDTEFSFRARSSGWRTAICRQAIVTHRSNPKGRTPGHSLSAHIHVYKSSVIFARIQKKYVLATVLSVLGSRRIGYLFKSGHFIKGLRSFFENVTAVVSGLSVAIRPVPRLRDKSRLDANKEAALMLLRQGIAKNNTLEFDVKSPYSMLPLFQAHDIVVIKTIPLRDIKRCDILVFKHASLVIAHRCILKTGEPGKMRMITKGDNLPYADPYVIEEEDLFGKIIGIKRRGHYIDFEHPAQRVLHSLICLKSLFQVFVVRPVRAKLRQALRPQAKVPEQKPPGPCAQTL